VPAIFTPVAANGTYGTNVTLSRTLAAGTYDIGGRCGGGNLGVQGTLVVNGAAASLVKYVPLTPQRILDTRAATQVGYSGSKPGVGATVELAVTGAAVPADAVAVVLNVTGTEASAPGFVTVWPCGQARPTASNLNLLANGTTPNLVIAKLGAGGKVCLFTQTGTHLLADLEGYYPSGATFTGLSPQRLLDTRPATMVGYSGAKPAAGSTVELTVTGGSVPADASAVVLNVTGTEATAPGFVTVWPCGSPRPTASNLNLLGGGTTPNLVIAKVGAAGKVCLFTQAGTHLVADLEGFYPASATLTSLTPQRLLDTRPGTQVGYAGAKPAQGATVELQVTGGSVPPGATAAVLNVTGTEATAAGFVTVWPCGQARPTASNLNLLAGGTTPNLVIVKIGAAGKVCLFTQTGTHLLADLEGYES
jgi:hypothetical protein